MHKKKGRPRLIPGLNFKKTEMRPSFGQSGAVSYRFEGSLSSNNESNESSEHLQGYLSYLKGRKSPETLKSYYYTLVRYLEFLHQREPSLVLCEEFLSTLKNNAPSSICRHLGALRSFHRWLKAPIDIEPPRIPRRLPKYVTENQFTQLMSKAQSQELRAMLMILFGGGLRIGELTSLKRQDILPDYFRVIGKGDKERLVPVEESVMAEVKKWIKEWVAQHPKSPKSSWLFPGKFQNRSRTREGIQKILKDHLKACGMGDYRIHSLRHGAATSMYNHGADLKTIQEVLGHVNISTTSLYTHLSPARLKAQLPKRFGDAES